MSDTIITSKLDGDVLIVETDRDTQTYDAQFLVAAMLIYIARGGGSIKPEETQKMLWLAPSKGGIFTTQEREIMKSKEFREVNNG